MIPPSVDTNTGNQLRAAVTLTRRRNACSFVTAWQGVVLEVMWSGTAGDPWVNMGGPRLRPRKRLMSEKKVHETQNR